MIACSLQPAFYRNLLTGMAFCLTVLPFVYSAISRRMIKRRRIAEILRSVGIREKKFVSLDNLTGCLELAKQSLEQNIKEST